MRRPSPSSKWRRLCRMTLDQRSICFPPRCWEAQMPSTFVAPDSEGPAALPRTPLVSTDPDHLVVAVQTTLAALLGLEIRREIELDCLEDWPGPGEVKQSLLAERERKYRQARAVRLEQFVRLQERVRTGCLPRGPSDPGPK